MHTSRGKTSAASPALRTAENLRWFREAKLGIFLHWMAHSAVRPGDPATPGHVFNTPFKQYCFLLDRFTLDAFDADRFVARIKALGARYLIPTSHHADGLCLWDTATTGFKMTNAPARLDVIGALAEACRRQGLRFGVYVPYCDMSHPLMQPLFATGQQDSAGWGDQCPLTPDQLAAYRGHLKAQMRELCTRYGEIAVLWWDGGPADRAWVREIKQAAGKAEVSFAPPDSVRFASRVERTDTGYIVWFTVPFASLLKDSARPRPDYDLLNFFGLPRRDIPLSPSAAPVRPGDVIGVNISVNAPSIENGVLTKRTLWWQARSHSPFNDPHQWGRLRLARKGDRHE